MAKIALFLLLPRRYITFFRTPYFLDLRTDGKDGSRFPWHCDNLKIISAVMDYSLIAGIPQIVYLLLPQRPERDSLFFSSSPTPTKLSHFQIAMIKLSS